MNTIPEDSGVGRQRRRRHSDEFKAEAVAACTRPGVSMAAVAMSHGINANLLRRWVRDAEVQLPTGGQSRKSETAPVLPRPAFVPMAVPATAPSPGIRIELRRGATSITVTWPAAAAMDCAAWMRELLR